MTQKAKHIQDIVNLGNQLKYQAATVLHALHTSRMLISDLRIQGNDGQPVTRTDLDKLDEILAEGQQAMKELAD